MGSWLKSAQDYLYYFCNFLWVYNCFKIKLFLKNRESKKMKNTILEMTYLKISKASESSEAG